MKVTTPICFIIITLELEKELTAFVFNSSLDLLSEDDFNASFSVFSFER